MDKSKAARGAVIIICLIFVLFTFGRYYERVQGAESFTIYTESPGEVQALTPAAGAPAAADMTALTNINTAGSDELIKLPGIGEVLAERIIDYRSENGAFESISDIMAVTGIGEAKYLAIRDYICV